MNASQYIREFHLFASDLINDEGKEVPLAPVVVCGHCRVAIMDVNPDGSRINNPSAAVQLVQEDGMQRIMQGAARPVLGRKGGG